MRVHFTVTRSGDTSLLSRRLCSPPLCLLLQRRTKASVKTRAVATTGPSSSSSASAGSSGRVLPGSATSDGLAAYNAETMAKYKLPEVDRPDAHVYKDAEGYYVVKEEYRKPTNPFEKLKVAKDPMKETVHLAAGPRPPALNTST